MGCEQCELLTLHKLIRVATFVKEFQRNVKPILKPIFLTNNLCHLNVKVRLEICLFVVTKCSSVKEYVRSPFETITIAYFVDNCGADLMRSTKRNPTSLILEACVYNMDITDHARFMDLQSNGPSPRFVLCYGN